MRTKNTITQTCKVITAILFVSGVLFPTFDKPGLANAQGFGNIVPNPSFEEPDPANPSLPTYWSPQCEDAIWDNTTAHGGTHSVKAYSVCGWYSTITILDPNYNYQLSIWHKDQGFCPYPARIRYTGYDEFGNITMDSQIYFPCSDEWVQSSFNLLISSSYSVINERTSNLYIELVTAAPGTAFTDTVWWDDVILKRVLPGDANGDGTVDGIDYVIWLNHYGQTVSGGPSVGDFNEDGTVDGIDYVIWRNNYGK